MVDATKTALAWHSTDTRSMSLQTLAANSTFHCSYQLLTNDFDVLQLGLTFLVVTWPPTDF